MITHDRAPVFFIGFNKCGTTSLHLWLTSNGLESFHGGARENALVEGDIVFNITFGDPPLKDILHKDAWLDVGPVQREWREFVRCYPDSKFVLNTRDINRWLVSRLNHLSGRYVQYMNVAFRRDATWQEWVAEWRQEFIDHERAVMDHFRDRPNFLRFDIERDNAGTLADFLGIEPSGGDLPRDNVTMEKFFFLEGSVIKTRSASPGG
jgi:hypothetical protein